jgi:hypothetical protein
LYKPGEFSGTNLGDSPFTLPSTDSFETNVVLNLFGSNRNAVWGEYDLSQLTPNEMPYKLKFELWEGIADEPQDILRDTVEILFKVCKLSNTSTTSLSSSTTSTVTVSTTSTTSTGSSTSIISSTSTTTSSTTTTSIKNNSTTSSSSITSSTTTTGVSGTIQLPQTGQTTPYYAGDDGTLQKGVDWPNPRFTVNSDNSITDKLTGLVWAPDGNLTKTRDPGWYNDDIAGDGAVTWQHAFDYVAKLNNEKYLGYSDWHLPNINELESLLNEEQGNPGAWLITKGFTNVQSNIYWSSTTYADPSIISCAWSVDMSTGYVWVTPKSYYTGKLNYYYVWPVRAGQAGGTIQLQQTGQKTCYEEGGSPISCAGTGQDGDIQAGVVWPNPRFKDNGNGTVKDNLTGLIWLKNANPCGTKTWNDALVYCNSLASGTAGLTDESVAGDWRLPNQKELRSLCDYSHWPVALPQGYNTFFTNVQFGDLNWYWTSTTSAYITDSAWFVYMRSGAVGCAQGLKSSSGCNVWPVRSGQ